jgi:hypothetical protein
LAANALGDTEICGFAGTFADATGVRDDRR